MNELPDLTVLILTFNEEINLPYALKNLEGFAKEVVILDSWSSDKTLEIAHGSCATVYRRRFDNFANQRNFALAEIEYATEWLFILDADELITDELKDEICETLNKTHFDAFFIKRRFFWMGQWIKRGYYPTWLLRLGRVGTLVCDERPINEHLVCTTGKVGRLREDFIDYNRKPLSDWLDKHNRYSTLEAQVLLENSDSGENYRFLGSQYERKRWIRAKIWNQLPPLVRPFLYFFYRYFLCLGFMDGKKAFVYHFLHAFFYRVIIDLKYLEKKWLGNGK